MTNRESQARCFIALVKMGFPLLLIAIMFLVKLSILCFAVSPGDVVINEVAWMGTEASTSDEWIELYNNTDQGIDLADWILVAADGTLNITLSGVISAHGYFLLERTDDNAISDIAADWSGSFGTGLLNTGDVLTLADGLAQVIDTANGNGGPWLAGSNISSTDRYTMERINPLLSDTDTNWATNDPDVARNGRDANSGPINGTPKARNSATNTRPIVDAGTHQVVVLGDNVQLDGSASSDPDGDSLSYSWAFVVKPIGSAAVLSNQTVATPTFVADAAGDYILQLLITDSYHGSDTDGVTITAQAPPVADFSYSPAPPTTWNTIQFIDESSDTDGTIVDWAWNFGDGESANDRNAIHRYCDLGMYQVALTVTDNDGLIASTIREIKVSLGPGDITGDGAIDVIDVRLCLQIAEGVIPGTTAQREQADVNGDGDVDLADAQILADYIIGIRSPLLEGGQP